MPTFLDTTLIESTTRFKQKFNDTVGSIESHVLFRNYDTDEDFLGVRLDSNGNINFDTYSGSSWIQQITIDPVINSVFFRREVIIGQPGGSEGFGYGYGEEGASTGSLILYGDLYVDDEAVFAENVSINGSLTISGELTVIGGGLLPTGTTANSILHWSGSEWVENTNVTATTTGSLEITENLIFGVNNVVIKNNSISFIATPDGDGNILIASSTSGSTYTSTSGVDNSIIIGANTFAPPASNSINIGTNLGALSPYSIAIGTASGFGGVGTSSDNSVAIGSNAVVSGATYGIALGSDSSVAHGNSVAIGRSAASTKANQLVLGNATYITEILIPATTAATSVTSGALVVAGGAGISGSVYINGTTYSSTDSGFNFGSTSAIPLSGSNCTNNALCRAFLDGGTGDNATIYGRAVRANNAGKNIGVAGHCLANVGDGTCVGVDGLAVINVGGGAGSSSAIGVNARVTTATTTAGKNSYGVLSSCTATGASNAAIVYGGSFTATGAATSVTSYAVYGSATGAITNWAGYFVQDVYIGDDLVQASDSIHYFGDKTTDGSWRFVRSGNNFVIERRESGSWVTKLTINA